MVRGTGQSEGLKAGLKGDVAGQTLCARQRAPLPFKRGETITDTQRKTWFGRPSGKKDNFLGGRVTQNDYGETGVYRYKVIGAPTVT